MFAAVFSFFERLSSPFTPAPAGRGLPSRMWPFYRHFIGQFRWPLLALMVVGLFVALIEVAIYDYVGRLVDMLTDTTPARLFADHGPELVWMAVVVMVLRPIFSGLHSLIKFQTIEPQLTNLVRWQMHTHALRHSLAYFQNDFAGRIANKIIQTGPALRGSVVDMIDAIWFVVVYIVGALALFAKVDFWLAVPLLVWLVAYALVLRAYVPQIKRLAVVMSEARSMLTGRVVDSYTNIQTVKLFASSAREEAFARDGLQYHTGRFHEMLRPLSAMVIWLWLINGLLSGGTAALSVWLWADGLVTVGALALATGLALRVNNMSGWIMWTITNIFENVGTVEEGMETIARPHGLVDRTDARPIQVTRGAISFRDVSFHYGRQGGIIEGLSLDIRPGEKIGLIGRSGAGKSTLVNLLLRFYDLEGGEIRIDGQNIAEVTQDSLRGQIGVVTQDTSLLHRSVLDNVTYGRPDATRDQALVAAGRAHAADFLDGLADMKGRTGLDAHVGERGVKLSGGQRQRIAIARVLLKDAPILVLDEATSALDSEIEAAIQESLFELMEGKTVIAIAHRLSTIAAMDRLVVMDQGRIVEEGTHDQLLKLGGIYAQLWNRQSGGFLDPAHAA